MGEQDNITQGAREMADLLKEGNTEDFKDRLRDDFQNMSHDDFRELVHKIDEMNAADRQVDKNLPDIEFHETSMSDTTAIQSVDITTPGKIFGNWWRNSETVDLTRGGSGMVGHLDSVISGRRAMERAALEEPSQRSRPIEQQRQ